MGKICKYANIYSTEKDNDGKYKLIRKINNNGVLEDYTMEELEQFVDDLGNDKDEDGKIKNKLEFNNASSMLFFNPVWKYEFKKACFNTLISSFP